MRPNEQISHQIIRTQPIVEGAVIIRTCTRGDLRALEWDGLFSHHREIFELTFRQQLEGEQLMLVAELDRALAAQAWVDFCERADDGAGKIWAVRVHPRRQGLGLGRRVMTAAEERIRDRGLGAAVNAVERSNVSARAFYTRLGYAVERGLTETYGYTTPEGERCHHELDLLEMRKEL